MRKIIFISLQLLFCSSLIFAGGVGTTGSQFLKLGVGARPAGMGEANAALSDDVNAIWWNPAGLYQVEHREITAMHNIWFEDIFFSNVAYCQPGLKGVIGGAVNYLSSGKIDKIDKDGNDLGKSYSNYDVVLILSYGRLIKNIPLGANIKLISSTLEDESAYGFAFDLGGLYKLMEDRLSLGLVLQNIGMGLKFIEERDPLPVNIKIGAAYRILDNKLILALDINYPLDYDLNAHIGAEYTYEIGNIIFMPRVGYKTTTISDLGTLSGLSAGFGTRYELYGIDYAWVPYGDLGNTHRISLSAKF